MHNYLGETFIKRIKEIRNVNRVIEYACLHNNIHVVYFKNKMKEAKRNLSARI